MFNHLLFSLGISPSPNFVRCKEERAVRIIAESLRLDFDDVLASFAVLDDGSVAHAKAEGLEGQHLLFFYRECRLTNLRILLGSQDPSKLRDLKKRIKVLEQTTKRQAKLLNDIEAFGKDEWDETFGRFEGQSSREIYDFYACMVGELGIRKSAISRRKPKKTVGRVKDERPFYIARAIADIFYERNWNIGVGRNSYDDQGPSGRFCKTVALALSEFGLDHDFFRPAQDAQSYANNKMKKNSSSDIYTP